MMSEMDGFVEDVDSEVAPDTAHETGCARAWFSASIPGSKTGCEVGVVTREGSDERRVEGNARDERYVDAVRYRSL